MFLYLILPIICCYAQVDQLRPAVLELSEKFLDVMHDGHWFVEFYAPWCGHCKKLQPIWDQVGALLADKASRINVGRIDCTRFSDVAHKLAINGFPTIKYFRNGEEFTYEGDRNREALIEYALKLEGPEVRLIPNRDIFARLYKEHYMKGGLFILISDNDDSDLKNEFAQIAKEMFSKVHFAQISKENLPDHISVDNTPAVVTFKDSNMHVYNRKESDSLKSWISSERWPIMPMITYGNLYEIGLCCNKLLVIVVSHLIERSKKESPVHKFHSLVKETAKSHYSDLHKHFQFGWTDGDELATSILLKSTPPPALLVFNVSSYEYYVSDDSAEYMTKESLRIFLKSIINGEIRAFGGKGIIQRFKRMIFEIYSAVHGMFASQPLLSCCLFGLPLGVLSIICYTLCSTDNSVDREEIYKESDDEVDDEEESEIMGENHVGRSHVKSGSNENSDHDKND